MTGVSEQTFSSDDELMEHVLSMAKVIAVVGLSDNPSRPSYGVARYLQSQGYRIIPVNPTIDQALGERSYPDLRAVPEPIDIVDLFRRSSEVGPHVDEALELGVKAIWMQLGVFDQAAAQRARHAGLHVVMNRCIAVEHRRLLGTVR